jgi:hypothetical protein
MVDSINLQLLTAACWCVPGPRVLRISASSMIGAGLLSHQSIETAYLEEVLRNLGFTINGKPEDACFT